jgi:hypothetical protein
MIQQARILAWRAAEQLRHVADAIRQAHGGVQVLICEQRREGLRGCGVVEQTICVSDEAAREVRRVAQQIGDELSHSSREMRRSGLVPTLAVSQPVAAIEMVRVPLALGEVEFWR